MAIQSYEVFRSNHPWGAEIGFIAVFVFFDDDSIATQGSARDGLITKIRIRTNLNRPRRPQIKFVNENNGNVVRRLKQLLPRFRHGQTEEVDDDFTQRDFFMRSRGNGPNRRWIFPWSVRAIWDGP